jgi:SAM-dependent methyltransferase
VIAERIAMELDDLSPTPPALRVFDAGVGDGTVLARVMRSMHDKFPTMPFYVVGKEISLEDVRLALDKMPDRFHEHPATVLVMTNMYYREAPWLTPEPAQSNKDLCWREVALSGNTSAQFDRQIAALHGFLTENWAAKISQTTGNPLYERPAVLVIYRADHQFLLAPLRPTPADARAEFDLVIASQPYRARAPVKFKSEKVVAPLVRALGPGGRLIGIHSYGHDPGLEIIQRIWPDENPFQTSRDELMRATKQALGAEVRNYVFNVYADQRSIFEYEMHTLPSEISTSVGTSTLLAAWNAAIYVAQIEDHRLQAVMGDSGYLDATRDILRKHGRLWFQNESYVVARRAK